ncbi:MAG: hypothetical protein LBM02_10015 [Lachnospiraceae bacterium]|jgi:hypothetical protein|nr:hypothetical protein [Lachnospiraceae bacterium]
MSFGNYQNFPTQINGEEIISVTQGKKAMHLSTFQGMLDRNEYLYNEAESRYHLGLISAWGMQSRESYPMIAKLLERGYELLVKGFFGEFTYDKPFYNPKQGMHTIASTVSEAGDYPGIDESEFDIILSEKCYPGDIIGTDLYGDEEQLHVRNCEASELNGEGWRTTVVITSPQAGKYYNPSLLEANIKYYKINHAGVEYTTQFTGVDAFGGSPTGTLRARFKLGGIRGVEGFVTGFADAINSGLAAAQKDDESEKAMEQMRQKYANGDSSADTVIFGNKQEFLRNDFSNMRATSLMEFLVERTLAKRTATSHLWQKQGQLKSANGAIVYLNEGVWHQLRRGKIITIPKFMGITKSHIAEAVNYVFRGNPDLPWEEREITIEGGKLFVNNMLLLFQNEVQQQFRILKESGMLQALFGNSGILGDKLKNSFVDGSSLNELELKSLLKFTSVTLIGIAGKVTINHNPAMDYLSGNPTDFRGQFQDGYDWPSHSGIIWDVSDQQYSNNEKNIRDAVTLQGDTKIKGNLYLVRPEEGMIYKGQENGRWNRGMTKNIISSSRVIGQSFWAYSSSAKLILNPDRVVMIELSKGARRAGLTPYNY